MTISYATTLRSSRMQAVADEIDAGSSVGSLEICTSGYSSVLATIPLAAPCGTVTSGVLNFTAAGMTDPSAAAGGTAAIARIKDSDDNIVISGLTVGASGADINLSLGVSINLGDPVTITSASITEGNA